MPGFQSTRLATEGDLEPFFFLYTDDSIHGNPETCKRSSIMLNYEVKNKLGREVGFSKAAKELGVNIDTLYGWNKRAKDARLDLGPGTQTPDTAMSLTEEVQKLRQQNREQAKEIARLKEENEFLAEASAFFAASRRKSTKH